MMANRICVWIDGGLYPVNHNESIIMFHTGKPEKIGDDVIVTFNEKNKGYIPKERKVRLLKSAGHVKDTTYLVDLMAKEAWPYAMQ